jgi:glycosyltransferase involved in cell wall biosynthesis
MNILFFSELFYPHGGGAELATYLYAKLLSEAGFPIIVVTNRFNGEFEVSKSKNLVIYRLPLFEGTKSVKYSVLRRIDVLSSCFIRKLMKWSDVVYVPRFWYSVILLAKLYKRPVVVHLHDYIPVCPLSNLYNASKEETCSGRNIFCSTKCIYNFEKMQGKEFLGAAYSATLNFVMGALWRKFVDLCDMMVCVSRTQRDVMLKADSSLKSRVSVIYNPLPNIQHSRIEGEDFGYFGGPNFLKGFHVIYRAVSQINKKESKSIEVHATNFSKRSDRFLTALSKSGFRLYCRLDDKALEKVYGQIRCVVVPSIWPETFSYVTVESLLRGRMVLASRIGAIPEITNGCAGALLFPAGNVEQLMERLLYIKNLNRETVIDLGEKSRQVMKRKFNNQKTISEFIRILYSVLDKPLVTTNINVS